MSHSPSYVSPATGTHSPSAPTPPDLPLRTHPGETTTLTTISTVDLAVAATETIELLPRVRALIPATGTRPADQQPGRRGRASASPTPWNDAFALLALSIADDARRHESALTLACFGHATYRPATDEITDEVITRLPDLIHHADQTLDDPGVADIATDLASWPRRLRAALGELRDDELPWTKAPGDLRCPHCDRRLRLAPGWTEQRDASGNISSDVWCLRCRDDDGNHLRWAPSQWTGKVLAAPTTWVTAAEAAALLDLPVSTVRVRAHRQGWRRTGTGKHVRYHRDDALSTSNTTTTGDAVA